MLVGGLLMAVCTRILDGFDDPSFALELAPRSLGEILLSCLLLAAIDEGAHTFDFGLGCEPFKLRFATTANRVRKWEMY